MPRGPRLDVEGALHHVMARGLNRCAIFRTDRDREEFVGRLEILVPATGVAVYAWALMGNHLHLLVRTGPVPLSGFLRRLLTGHAVAFNRRHRRTGHLFQNRYRSVLVEEEPYFLELVRYIHLNPVRAGTVDGVDGLDAYPWTGHSAVMGAVVREWQDTEAVLARFGAVLPEAALAYRAFVAAGAGQGRRDELSGGGLVRSLVAAGEDLGRAGRGARAFDERILGSSAFVQRVWREADARGRRAARRTDDDLTDLINRAAELFGVTPAELCGPGRRRPLVAARRWVSWVAVRQWGLGPTAVARVLGVSRQTVLRGAEAHPACNGGARPALFPTGTVDFEDGVAEKGVGSK